MKALQRLLLCLALVVAVGGTALAQGTSGSLNGSVTHDGEPLPGVTVTVTSPSLQGQRVTYANINGDYNIPGLPPGEYTVTFEADNMQTVRKSARVGLARTERVNAELALSNLDIAIVVTVSPTAVLETTDIQANYPNELVEELPILRTVQSAAILSPGVTANGPAGAIVISGAPAFDSLYLVNGAVTNENVRGQTDNLFIEDAIEETSVLTGSISAEYGRFTGGVVSAITKSGGNEFSGSFRDSFTNPSWTDATDFSEDKAPSELNEVYEATLGGRIVRDRLWFFLAGRYAEQTAQAFYTESDIQYETSQEDERFELKLTGQLNPNHSLVGSYLDYTVSQTDFCPFGCYEAASIDPSRNLPREMMTAHYNGILTSNLLLEAGYSTRDLVFEDSGGDAVGDQVRGTWGYDYAGTGQFFGAPVFCGPCPPETRENAYYQLKGTYYLATSAAGTHSIVSGYENFTEERFAENYQSASDFGIYIFNTSPERAADGTVLPVITGVDDSAFGLGDMITWWPILESSQGTEWITDSVFVNDKWDLSDRWSFNLGARYDRNEGRDSSGNLVADDDFVSPRLGLIFDVKGDGRFRINGSYSKYVSRIQETIGGAAGAGGNPAYIFFEYRGPTLSGVPTFEAFEQLFDWFNAQGGTSATNLIYLAGVPGYSTVIDGKLDTPNVDEWTLGFGTQIGTKGFVRVDYIDREWNDFYARFNSPGDIAVNPYGFESDVTRYFNSNDLVRTYQGAQLQASYRVSPRLNIGGNYTWSETKGNVASETAGGGPLADATFTYLEYKAFPENNPNGFLASDQTHKGRLWVGFDQPLGSFGSLNATLFERYDSGTPYSAIGLVAVAPFVDNPGYLNPPSTSTYYFSERGEYRFEDLTATDVALNWELPLRQASVFLQGEVINVFNEQAQIGGSVAVRVLSQFNPFTEEPVEGVDWEKRSTFGQATSPNHYQQARTYRLSAGIRF